MKDFLFRYMLIIRDKIPWLAKFITIVYNYLIYFFSNITSNKKDYLKNLEEGEKLLNEYTKDNKYYYVLINLGIGDSIIVASYAYYLKEKYNKDIAFIVLPSHINVIAGFDYISKIIKCPKADFDKIFLYIARQNVYETDKYKYSFFNVKVSRKGVRNWATCYMPYTIPLSERYKKFVFSLNDSTPMYKLKIKNDKKEINSILKKNNIEKKSILLIPYAYSTANLDTKMWEQLANILKEKGYKVYTNIGNPSKEPVIFGTSALSLPIDIMLKISNKFSYIISNRCGLAEFLANNDPNLIIIDEWEKYPCGWDDANIYSSKKTIKYVYRDMKNKEKLIKDILNVMGVKK